MQALLPTTKKHEQAIHHRRVEGEEVFIAPREDQVDFSSTVSIFLFPS